MDRTVDVAIIGGGAVGNAVACFLGFDPAFDGQVLVIERDPSLRQASSALSASSIRQQFSTPENIRMSRFGFEFLADADRLLSVDGSTDAAPDIGLIRGGYLYLATPDGADNLRDNHRTQLDEGADVVLLTADELAARFPWMVVHGVALASLGRSGEGWFDGYALARALARKAQSLGAEPLTAEVVGMDVSGSTGRIDRLQLADGSAIAAGHVVDAAGPWAASVAAMAGVSLPVHARRRCVFVFDAGRRLSDCPLVIDTSGVWFRPEGQGFIAGASPAPADDLDDLPLEVDRRMWEDVLWPALAARVPLFDAVRVSNAWAGYYEMNTFDHNAILGAHPDIPNLLFANGFSGHGIQQAPAVGRAVAELIVHGRFVSLDLSVFAFDRIPAGRPILERNVIG